AAVHSSPPGSEAAIVQSLASLLDDPPQRKVWAKVLLGAVADERRGRAGALSSAFSELVHERGEMSASLHEVQPVITMLRAHARPDNGASIEDAFHATRVMIGALTYRHAGEQHLRNERILDELRASCDRLATSLELADLKQALIAELPRLGVPNGFVA